MRKPTSTLGRVAAGVGLVAVIAAVVVIMLGPGRPSYNVKVYFLNAAQLVSGNDVQIAGVRVGQVTDLKLTPNGQAEATIQINSSDYTPLRQGTRAILRQSSLSGLANRYIDLQLPEGNTPPIPDGGRIDIDQTVTQVDLDEVFNTFDPMTRVAVQEFFKGQARQFRGQGERANQGLRYLNPALSTSRRLFNELNRDTPLLARFLQESDQLVTALATRRDDLTELITHWNVTTRALGNRRVELKESLEELPNFMRLANTTLVELRGTLDEVDPLVEASKPVARRLPAFFDEVRPLARDARPTLRDLRFTVRRRGPDNDAVELGRTFPPLARTALDPVTRSGERRLGAFPETAKAFRAAAPNMAFSRQYVVDLVGWFDDFSHTGHFDALAAFSRAQIYVALFDFLGIDEDEIPDVIADIRELNNQIAALEATLGLGPGEDLPAELGVLQPVGDQLEQLRQERAELLDRALNPLDELTDAFLNQTKQDQVERCPGAAEEVAPDKSNEFSEEERDFLNCDEDDRAVGEF
jgi:phospholipid/cholesterol/gamma-HCH transport system substrate-binding protein